LRGYLTICQRISSKNLPNGKQTRFKLLAFARHNQYFLIIPGRRMKDGVDKSGSGWEKAKILSAIVASVFIPLAVALSGNWYAKSLKEKDIQARLSSLRLAFS